jgi:Tol biopolymer transport system component
MSHDRLDELEPFASLFEMPATSFEGFVRRRDRKRRNQRIAAGLVAIAVFVVPVVWVVVTGGMFERTQTPASTGIPSSVPVPRALEVDDSTPVPAAPDVDYVIDLDTNVVSRLPKTILGSVVRSTPRGTPRYAVSSNGSRLAYVGTGDDGNPQIFVGRIDGTGLRQVTHDRSDPTSPAWSPDGTTIAYVGSGSEGRNAIFVLDVASGETRKVIDGIMWDPSFTPDGSSILYTGGSNQRPVLRTVPVAGSESSLLIGPSEGIDDAGNGSLSPDGSVVTFLGSGEPESGEVEHCGPCRFVANADGTGRRVIAGWMAISAGTWSPDGTRIVTDEIVTSNGDVVPSFILVVDVATGAGTKVADGRAAIWINDHMLLVEVR